MADKTKNYAFQYKVLIYLSWFCLYLIFPTWISSHTIFQGRFFGDLSDPVARSLVILGFTIFFSISAFLINHYFSALTIDKPVIMKINDLLKIIKSNIWLVIICCLSVALHVSAFSFVELGYLTQGLWIYDFSDKYWHIWFDFPIQYGFWSLVVLSILIIKRKKTMNSISSYISAKFIQYKSNSLVKFLLILSLFSLFSLYSHLFPYSWDDAVKLLREPPVSHYLYLITYYSFGVSQMGPRIVQLIFYILGAVYLYRTIHLFHNKETALLGATIYLFSPIIFHYASLTFLSSGAVFFMILISFYFLRFIKEEDNRDLILTSYFIGLGFMYRREILLMLIICFAYLVLNRIKKRSWHSFIHFKILLLSLITVLPFYMIGRSGVNFYAPALSNLISFDFIFLVIQSQLSFILSLLLLFSIVFVLFKRDELSLFYSFYFIAYYLFFTLQLSVASQRYSMALYPAIAALSAQFIFSITQRVNYKHIFKMSFSILTVYLIFLCLVPRSNSDIITFKYKDFESQQYPVEKATEWIRNETTSEKILTIMPAYYKFYLERIYEDKDSINQKRFIHYEFIRAKELISPLQNLKEFCYSEKISYIMFPYAPKNTPPDIGASEWAKYLKKIRDDAFMEVAKFNHEDNYILIYKLNEDSDFSNE